MSQTEQKLKLIDRIYGELPAIKCKGLCHEACGPILLTQLESRRINLALSKPADFGFNDQLQCDLLDPTTKRCSVYSIRPLVCRLFGMVPGMICPFGCTPERMLSEDEQQNLLGRVTRIGS